MTAYTIWQNGQPVARCDDATDAAQDLKRHACKGRAELRRGRHAKGELIAWGDDRQAAWEARMEASPAVTRAAND